MKITSLVAVTVLSLIIFNGCTTSTRSTRSTEVPLDTAAPSSAANGVRQEIISLGDQTRLAEMRVDGDISADIKYLKTEVQRLGPQANAVGGQSGLDLRKQLDSISARLNQLEQAGMARLPAAQSPLATPGVSPGTPGQIPVISGTLASSAAIYPGQPTDPGSTASSTAPPTESDSGMVTTQPPSSTTPAPPPPQGSGAYEKGKTAFDQKQYQPALTNFKDYLVAEPRGANAAAAQFYIGETYYAQDKYEEAIVEYQKVVTGYPKSSQVPTTLLKQAIAFQTLGDTDSAKMLYKKVIRDYPKSYATGVAKERIGKL